MNWFYRRSVVADLMTSRSSRSWWHPWLGQPDQHHPKTYRSHDTVYHRGRYVRRSRAIRPVPEYRPYRGRRGEGRAPSPASHQNARLRNAKQIHSNVLSARVRPTMNDRIQLNADPVSSNEMKNRSSRMEWSTVSEAAITSSKASNEICPLSIEDRMSDNTRSRPDSVEWCFRNPDCSVGSNPFAWGYSESCRTTTLFTISDTKER